MDINQAINLLNNPEIDEFVKKKLSIFLDAINDFPIAVNSLEEYICELQKEISPNLNKKKLENKLSNIDFSIEAWKAESISTILEIYNFYSIDLELNKILNEIITECYKR
jgi:hypothetical protein